MMSAIKSRTTRRQKMFSAAAKSGFKLTSLPALWIGQAYGVAGVAESGRHSAEHLVLSLHYDSDRGREWRASQRHVDTLRCIWSSPGTMTQTGVCRRGRPEDADLVVTGYTGAAGVGVPGRHAGAAGVREDTD